MFIDFWIDSKRRAYVQKSRITSVVIVNNCEGGKTVIMTLGHEDWFELNGKHAEKFIEKHEDFLLNEKD